MTTRSTSEGGGKEQGTVVVPDVQVSGRVSADRKVIGRPTTTQASASVVARLTVNLPERVWRAVVDMAEEDGISKTEALRRCISTEMFIRQLKKEGSDLIVKRPGGTLERITFPY